MPNGVTDRVAGERRQRGWSIRAAAHAGGISNTLWGRYEAGEAELSGRIRQAVATAFGWPMSWPEDPGAGGPDVRDEAAERFAELLDARSACSLLGLSHSSGASIDSIDEVGDPRGGLIGERASGRRQVAGVLAGSFGLVLHEVSHHTFGVRHRPAPAICLPPVQIGGTVADNRPSPTGAEYPSAELGT